MRALLTLIATVAITALALTGLAGTASARPLPVTYSLGAATAVAIDRPDSSPPGANDWSCRPTARHPQPVVLSHGTLFNMTIDWQALSPLLRNAGYCVYAFNFGQQPGSSYLGFPGAGKVGGTGPIEESAATLARFVDRVKASTGAAKVDIVGHSQGGMMPRYYLRNLGGAASVDQLIGLAPSNHGTTVLGLAAIPGVPEALRLGLGTAIRQQLIGSDFLRRLNAGGDTVPGVRYTVIETRFDEVVTPYTSAFLRGPNVTNIDLQQSCDRNFTDHLSITYDRRALSYVLHALDPAAPIAPCTFSSPLSGA
ncbi:esterase/lipase family protein [Williamsia maris]|uniref:Triacylglycerol esterase/lipase EstA, alpha/beta hydrolase fold n=1 Tax=Williamsia maris TaxID=72806 RepID=A0ABT1HD56_9NOCA|nr:alpha/beta fold hydrolase [Williamsia maris]MCP2176189.1 Triacylglycerol esterase/lipase EstA, alpha/beta hydrolase fold [Williamsia maris]